VAALFLQFNFIKTILFAHRIEQQTFGFKQIARITIIRDKQLQKQASDTM